MSNDIDQLAINTIRTLSMDAVQAANSGHPGTPMALAPVAYTLWQNFLRWDPEDPVWPDRDRFVLSAGHASMLLYSMLHLTQTKAVDDKYQPTKALAVPLDDIKKFRQLDSKCPGHPEYHLTSGVETTTGPLGQGVATSVGMAIAAKWKGAYFNRPDFSIIDHDVYAICGDGDMMEGISNEAASIAGHLKLDNLCWIYDSNRITIEGSTDLAFSEEVGTRFLALGWHVLTVGDANDTTLLDHALKNAKQTKYQPTLIIVHSHIGFGSPHKQDSREAHGEALGEDEVKLTKKFYGWPEDQKFLIPDGVLQRFADGVGKRGKEAHAAWNTTFAKYKAKYPELADGLERMQRRELPEGWDKDIPSFPADAKGLATRDSSQKVLNAIAKNTPWLIGGAADLAPSTKSNLTFEGAGSFEALNYGGRNFHFGIREHAMTAIVNGMALSKVRAYGSGFLIFSDYARPSIRLSSIMELPTIQIFTHDSIGVGEDGPTHQPIEQLASLRAMPGMTVLRPADANEVAEAWRVLMKFKHHPVCLVLTRQALPTLDRSKYASAEGVAKGAYVLADCEGTPSVILMATGSEVQLCITAHEALTKSGVKSRVVSMPSWELFDQQPQEYQEQVLPTAVSARIAVEQAASFGWHRYAGRDGKIIAMKSFGASAPLKDLLTHFGFTAAAVEKAARELVAGTKPAAKEGK